MVLATKELRSRTAKVDVLASAVVAQSGKGYLVGYREVVMKLSVTKTTHHRSTATLMQIGLATRQHDCQRGLER